MCLINPAQLRSIYEQSYAAFQPQHAAWQEAGLNVSQPLLMKPDAFNYFSASPRLLVVGQETKGWGATIPQDLTPGQAVDWLQDGYEQFQLGAGLQPQGPFWQYAHQLRQHLSPDAEASPRDFHWTNLSKVDLDNGAVNCNIWSFMFCNFNVLQSELRCLNPEVVVFFTGHDRDSFLLARLPGVQFHQVSQDTPWTELARLSHPLLPKRSYRTYHPRYLNLGNQALFQQLLNAL